MKIFLKTGYGELRIPMKVRKSYFKLTGDKITHKGTFPNAYYVSLHDINLIKSVERYCPNDIIRGFLIVEVPDDWNRWELLYGIGELPDQLFIDGELQSFNAPGIKT